MNDPTQPSLLPRRIAASAIDLALVGGLWLLVLYRLAVRIEIAQREPDGTPIYSANQRTVLAEVADGLNFGRIIGDFYYSVHGRGLILSMLALIVFSLIAWVLIPANTGWSAGHRALGLEVTDMKGNKPPLDSYLRRYLVGAVDLFPYVIPGLLGWVIASQNEKNQRFGDLSADTVVVAATPKPAVTKVGSKPHEKELVAAESVPAPPDGNAMVNVEEALAGHTADGSVDTHGAFIQDAAGRDLLSDAETDYPVLDLEDTIEVIPTIEADPPPPSHHDAIVIDTPQDTKSDVPTLLTESEPTIDADLPNATMAEDWHFPEAQEAPVWTPEPSDSNGPKTSTNHVVASEEGDPDAGSAGESAEDSGSTDFGDPVWNEEWSAWLYWDAKGSRWLRHDDENGWAPIPDSQNA